MQDTVPFPGNHPCDIARRWRKRVGTNSCRAVAAQ